MYLKQTTEGERQVLELQGDWTIAHLQGLEKELKTWRVDPQRPILILTQHTGTMDLSGAWLIWRKVQQLRQEGVTVELEPDEHFEFIESVEAKAQRVKPAKKSSWVQRNFAKLGRWTVEKVEDMVYVLEFLGRSLTALVGLLLRPHRIPFGGISQQVYHTGIEAIPIVGLIAFLISVVLAYQGAYQLSRFGADIFTIDLVAISVLREMGVLLTAIMVAGRSGSAFASQLGVMKINEEVDAMKTMGLNPFNELIVPRILGLMIALPLLTVIANLMGLAGAAFLSVNLLDIPLEQFLNRLEQAVSVSTWWVGLIKAPVFAFIIAFVGTLRGLQVEGSAEDVGGQTTVSVVQSIFLVIMADAVFSILFSRLGI